MGEQTQPVLGMRSCLDFIEEQSRTYKNRDDKHKGEEVWTAREWFFVENADVVIARDNSILPIVKLGVRACKQVQGSDGLEDAPLTEKDHPLVMYAKQFTRHFDLIA